jgi:photosystem II stability/assembly factor-like uncharacterized protein
MMTLTHRLLSYKRRVVTLALAGLSLFAYQSLAVTTIIDDYKSMVVSGSTVVALDFQSDLYTSDDDGASFVPRSRPAPFDSEEFDDVAAFGSTVIAVGDVGYILRAPDSGVTWSGAITPSISGTLRSAAGRLEISDNVWLSVGNDGDDGAVFRSTNDGSDWTRSATVSGITLEDVIWTGTHWVACGWDSFFNDGVVYFSTDDGLSWTASNFTGNSQPTMNALLALSSDGSGNVLAVGGSGIVFRSTDHGENFTPIASEYFGGGDFNAVIADGSGTFFIGGDEKLIIEVNGTVATTVVPAAGDAPSVFDFILINGNPVAIGPFFGSAVRTIPFVLQFSAGGSLDYVLTIEQTLVGRTYYVETTTDLTADDWAIVPNTSISGTGGQITFEVSEDVPRRFWRVVEF